MSGARVEAFARAAIAPLPSGTASVLHQSGLSPLGLVAVNTAAAGKGNVLRLGKVGHDKQKRGSPDPLVRGDARAPFFVTEPAAAVGIGSDPSTSGTTPRRGGSHRAVNGHEASRSTRYHAFGKPLTDLERTERPIVVRGRAA